MFGTVSIKPDGPIAMRNQRYPLTELGILNLTRRLVEVGEQDVKYGECEVKFYEGAKINNRRLHLHRSRPSGAAAELPLPSGADLRRQGVEPADPLRIVRLAEGEGRQARVDGRVHLPEPETQQRVHRRRFRHEEPELQVPLMQDGDAEILTTSRRNGGARSWRWSRLPWLIGCAVTIAYLLMVAVAMSLENSLIFFPIKYPEGYWHPPGLRFEDAWFDAADGVRLHGWYVPKENARGPVLFCHGNGGNITHRIDSLQILNRRAGVSVLIFDYRGYGRSEGTPNEAGVLADARAARAWLAKREKIAETDVVMMGESLGGGVAVDLAARDGAGRWCW